MTAKSGFPSCVRISYVKEPPVRLGAGGLKSHTQSTNPDTPIAIHQQARLLIVRLGYEGGDGGSHGQIGTSLHQPCSTVTVTASPPNLFLQFKQSIIVHFFVRQAYSSSTPNPLIGLPSPPSLGGDNNSFTR